MLGMILACCLRMVQYLVQTNDPDDATLAWPRVDRGSWVVGRGNRTSATSTEINGSGTGDGTATLCGMMGTGGADGRRSGVRMRKTERTRVGIGTGEHRMLIADHPHAWVLLSRQPAVHLLEDRGPSTEHRAPQTENRGSHDGKREHRGTAIHRVLQAQVHNCRRFTAARPPSRPTEWYDGDEELVRPRARASPHSALYPSPPPLPTRPWLLLA